MITAEQIHEAMKQIDPFKLTEEWIAAEFADEEKFPSEDLRKLADAAWLAAPTCDNFGDRMAMYWISHILKTVLRKRGVI